MKLAAGLLSAAIALVALPDHRGPWREFPIAPGDDRRAVPVGRHGLPQQGECFGVLRTPRNDAEG
jgi:hypothetical protein